MDSLFCLPANSIFDKISVLTYTDLAASPLLLNLFAIFSYCQLIFYSKSIVANDSYDERLYGGTTKAYAFMNNEVYVGVDVHEQYSRKYSISIIINDVIDDFLFLINFGLTPYSFVLAQILALSL